MVGFSPLTKARLPQVMAFLDWYSNRLGIEQDDLLKSWVYAEFFDMVSVQMKELVGDLSVSLPKLSHESAPEYLQALEQALRANPLELMSREKSPLVAATRQALVAMVERNDAELNNQVGAFLENTSRMFGFLDNTEAMWEIAFNYLEATAFALFAEHDAKAVSSAYAQLGDEPLSPSQQKVKLYGFLCQHFLKSAEDEFSDKQALAILAKYLMMETAYPEASVSVKASILLDMQELIPAFNLLD